MRKYVILLFSVILILPVTGSELTGERILEKMEDNMYARTLIYDGKMTITKGERTFVKTFRAWGIGDERAFVKFTNREDMGVKYLKIEDELWIAEEGDVVKVSGHLLKRSIMGSDFSFEDMMESHELSEIYEVSITGEEKIEEVDCHILTLKSDKEDAPYAKQKIWVGNKDFIPYRFEYFALSGRLMKSALVLKTEKIDNKNYPVKMKMVDELRKDSSTLFEMENIKLNVDIPDEIFSRQNLIQ